MATEAPPDVLTPEQREKIQGFLSDPLHFPPEFKQYLTDFLAVNIPPIPVSQLLGYKGTLARYDVIESFSDGNTASERTWIDLPDATGPEIAGIADGIYWAAFGYHQPGLNAGGSTQRMGPSINGADPTYYCGSVALDAGKTVWRAARLQVTGGNDNNTVTCKYWYDLGGGADAEYDNRWLVMLRIT